MKKVLITILFASVLTFMLNAQNTYQVAADGFSYNPESLTIQMGDKVEFTVGSNHPTVEISEESWNANNATPLDGGFSAPTGSETIEFAEAGTFYYICQNHFTSGMKGKIIVEQATSIFENTNSTIEDISFYPNPVVQYAFLDFELIERKDVMVTLYNLLGSRIKVFHKNTYPAGVYHLSLNFSDLPIGIYYLNVETEKIVKTIKVVK